MTNGAVQQRPIALIVGGTGFIGSHVTRALIEEGWDVTHFGPPGPINAPRLSNSTKRIDGSVTLPNEIIDVVAQTKPSLIIVALGHNIAGSGLLQSSETDELTAINVNSIGLRNVLNAASKIGVNRVIWTSSVVVYGPPSIYNERKVTEDAVLRPITSYGLTKALAEQLSLFYRDAHDLDICALRIPLVFGPGRWYEGVLGSIMAYLRPSQMSPLQPLQLNSAPFNLIYVKDVADAILRIANSPDRLAPAFNLAGFTTDFPEIIQAIERHRGTGELPAKYILEQPIYPLMSDNLIYREIGFTRRFDLAASLRDFAQSPEIGSADHLFRNILPS